MSYKQRGPHRLKWKFSTTALLPRRVDIHLHFTVDGGSDGARELLARAFPLPWGRRGRGTARVMARSAILQILFCYYDWDGPRASPGAGALTAVNSMMEGANAAFAMNRRCGGLALEDLADGRHLNNCTQDWSD